VIKKLLNRSEFAKNVITLVTGTSIAQALSLLAAPLLARLYTPEDFSVYALFASTSSILSVVATARYELAVPLPKEDNDAKSILRLSLLICIVVASVTLMSVLGYHFLSGEFKSEHYSLWFFLLPLSVFANGIYNAFNYWSTRIKTFYLNSAGRVMLSAGIAGVSIVLGYVTIGSSGLIIGLVAGQLAAMLVMAWPMLKDVSGFFRQTTKESVVRNGKTYSLFYRVNTPHALMDAIQDNGVVYLLTFYFVEAVTGWYSFAFRILKAPVGLIGAAFYQVFYQRLSQLNNEGQDMRPYILNMYRRLALIGLPGFTVLFIFTPQIFEWVFGPEWIGAGEIARILTPWLALNFIVSPVSCITLVCNRQRAAFGFTISDTIVRFSALVVGGVLHDYKLAFIIISVFSGLLMIFALWWYYSIAGTAFKKRNGTQ